MNEAKVSITGVNNVISFRGTLNHGIQPSTFVAEIIPQEIEEANVEIAVNYPDPAKAFELKDCLIDSSSYSASRSGLISTLYIKDFRWKWAYKRITLLANIRRGNGEIIIDDRYKYHKDKVSLSAILDELEKALGVRIRRVNATFPVNYYPEIIWDNYPAATALNDILAPLAIRIVPSYDSNIINLFDAGKGADLPSDDLESFGSDTNPREKPKKIRVVSAPVLKTVDVGLIPVIKTSRAYERADQSMFRPSSGRWGNVVGVSGPVPTYPNETGRNLTTQECEFVEESAFSWFAIGTTQEPPFENDSGGIIERPSEIVGYNANLKTRYDVLRGLQNFICEKNTRFTLENGADVIYVVSPRPPFVYGAFYYENEADTDANDGLTELKNSADSFNDIPSKEKELLSYVEDDTDVNNRSNNDKLRKFIVPVSFSIDFDAGLVKFGRKIYLSKKVADSNQGDKFFPELCLRIAVKTVNEYGTFNRLEYSVDVDPKSPADEIYIELNDIVPMWEYADGFKNRDNYIQQLREYAEQLLKTFENPDIAATATYAGIKAIELDGAIQSVSWTIGGSGARTTATRNQDTGDTTTLSFRARQFAIETGKSIRDAEIQRNANRRKLLGLPPL